MHIFHRYFIVENCCRRNFWRQQKFDFRKVWIEKVRFALRIDVIAQKLAPVAPGEVCEYLHFSLQFEYELNSVFVRKNADIRKLRLKPQERVCKF